MGKKLLIDASLPDETRIVMLGGKNEILDVDFDRKDRRQIKSNIYLARVTRVEPSLQAAFVDYGGNRHGFLPFSEIHPDYFQIPIADREKLMEEARNLREGKRRNGGKGTDKSEANEEAPSKRKSREKAAPLDPSEMEQPHIPHDMPLDRQTASNEAQDAESEADDDANAGRKGRGAKARSKAGGKAGSRTARGSARSKGRRRPALPQSSNSDAEADAIVAAPGFDVETLEAELSGQTLASDDAPALDTPAPEAPFPSYDADAYTVSSQAPDANPADTSASQADAPNTDADPKTLAASAAVADMRSSLDEDEAGLIHADDRDDEDLDAVPDFDADDSDEDSDEDTDEIRLSHAFLARRYKIQEVIKRRQIMLVQINKEERGNKGAALTTYLSLPGRYCVLMPNTPKGGGISRKISNPRDRRKLKDILDSLDLPATLSVIVRTAGSKQEKTEIQRDYEYLLRTWNEIRQTTLESTAPALIYEEGNIVKRAIRDTFTLDCEEVVVEGEHGYKTARGMMQALMPELVDRVKHHTDSQHSVMQAYGAEAMLEALHKPTVPLKSGGYLVINQTEALVAIDINSGKATRERSIEETAVKTNLEAADEIAHQLRLRQMAGLVVIDFIDMEERNHNRQVEKRMRDALAGDRARVQVGQISSFGLLELSRQRLGPSLHEIYRTTCESCGGLGHVRGHDAVVRGVMRSIEAALRQAVEADGADQACVRVTCATKLGMDLLNNHRKSLSAIEDRFGGRIEISLNPELNAEDFHIEGQEIGAVQTADNDARTRDDRGRNRDGKVSRKAGGRTSVRRPSVAASDESDAIVEDAQTEPELESSDDLAGDDDKARRRRGRRGGRKRGRGDDDASLDTADAQDRSENADRRRAKPERHTGREETFADSFDALLDTDSVVPDRRGGAKGRKSQRETRAERHAARPQRFAESFDALLNTDVPFQDRPTRERSAKGRPGKGRPGKGHPGRNRPEQEERVTEMAVDDTTINKNAVHDSSLSDNQVAASEQQLASSLASDAPAVQTPLDTQPSPTAPDSISDMDSSAPDSSRHEAQPAESQNAVEQDRLDDAAEPALEDITGEDISGEQDAGLEPALTDEPSSETTAVSEDDTPSANTPKRKGWWSRKS